MSKLYILQGPTASGKTHASILLAQHLNSEIISADSRQFYAEMNIGTAKPTFYELSSVKHHFISSNSITNPINVAQFEYEARQIIESQFELNKDVVVVGGSAQFIDALTHGLDPVPHFSDIHQKMSEDYSIHGITFLQNHLLKWDSEAYSRIDLSNSRRVIRALEVKIGSGKSILDYQSNNQKPFYEIKRFTIGWRREDLYSRINQRVDEMIDAGLENEVKNLSDLNNSIVMNTVGYKEWIPFFLGLSSKKDVIEKIKQHTRNYAKRQITWMNQYQDLKIIDPYKKDGILEQMLK